MRLSPALMAAFGVFLTACSASQSPSPLPADEGFAQVQIRAQSFERETATRLVELDRRVAKSLEAPVDQRSGKSSAVFPAEEERQLYVADVNLNRALEELYAQSWQKKTGDGELRAALLHWTVLIRRALMRDFHTRVPGLENDPDCAGDLVGDGMLLRYFDAVLGHQEVNAALALTDIARQSACLGTSQSAFLATVLADTFEELRTFLRLNGHEDLLPYVIQAGSAPLLLIYDVEKYRGSETPLAKWFRDHRDILIEGVESGRQPSRWHGLWLYDRRSGRMFGFKATPKPVDENDVNLARFYASIATPENLGDGRCSFAEMVERGMGAHGYLCAGASCGRIRSARSTRGGQTTLKGGLFAPAGVEKTFDRAICGEGGDGPGEQGRGPKCGEDPGHNRSADTVRCLTAQVVHAGTEGFQCFGETSGRCATPVESLVKDSGMQDYAGIKIGPDCALSSGMGAVKEFEWQEQRRLAKERRERQALIDELEKTVQDINREIAAMNQALVKTGDAANLDALAYEKEKKAAEAAGRDPNTDPKVLEAKAKAQESAAEDAKKRAELTPELVQAQLSKVLAEKALKEKKDAEEKLAKEEKEAAEKKEKEKKEAAKKAQEGNKHCVRDDPNCGDDLCTGMSQGTRETLACVQAALTEKAIDTKPPRPGVCDPRTCDPIEPNPGALGTLACFDAMAKDAATVTAKHCWAVRCALGQVPTVGTSGCTCREAGGGELSPTAGVNNFCTKMLCSEGVPTFQDGHCTCGGGGTNFSKREFGYGGYSGPSPKQLPPVFGQPSTYSEVRHLPPF